MSQTSTGFSRHERRGAPSAGKAVSVQLEAEAAQALLKIYSFPELKTIWGVPFNRPRLRERIAAGLFPAPIRISDNRVGWPGERLLAWRQGLIEDAYKPKRRTDPAANA
jgi:predicted DNA-binding transcriptional regulator AlpA